MKKFYVASGLENKEIVREVSSQLKALGMTHTYDWTVNERAVDTERLKEIGQFEKEAVLESDFIVVILPGGKGTHTEFGMALGLEKLVYLYTPDTYTDIGCTFYHLDQVDIQNGSVDKLIRHIKEKEYKE